MRSKTVVNPYTKSIYIRLQHCCPPEAGYKRSAYHSLYCTDEDVTGQRYAADVGTVSRFHILLRVVHSPKQHRYEGSLESWTSNSKTGRGQS